MAGSTRCFFIAVTAYQRRTAPRILRVARHRESRLYLMASCLHLWQGGKPYARGANHDTKSASQDTTTSPGRGRERERDKRYLPAASPIAARPSITASLSPILRLCRPTGNREQSVPVWPTPAPAPASTTASRDDLQALRLAARAGCKAQWGGRGRSAGSVSYGVLTAGVREKAADGGSGTWRRRRAVFAAQMNRRSESLRGHMPTDGVSDAWSATLLAHRPVHAERSGRRSSPGCGIYRMDHTTTRFASENAGDGKNVDERANDAASREGPLLTKARWQL
ncbi:hypothetical protein C8J57DRAFT_1239808 [Mycena rebaudengoi]|nr:hypothetical protein C8J57DRAFT_1239808 [Mycena rebaudengoi]